MKILRATSLGSTFTVSHKKRVDISRHCQILGEKQETK